MLCAIIVHAVLSGVLSLLLSGTTAGYTLTLLFRSINSSLQSKYIYVRVGSNFGR